MTGAPMWYGNILSKDKSNFNHVKEMFTKWQFLTQLPPTSGFFCFSKAHSKFFNKASFFTAQFHLSSSQNAKVLYGLQEREKKKLAQFKSFQRISNQAPIKYPLTYTIYSTNILMINIYIFFTM